MTQISSKKAPKAARKPAPKAASKAAPKAASRTKAKETAPLKRDRLIALLLNKEGVSIAEISTELGWLPHSTRAALSGLRKAGRDIERIAAPGKPSHYRIKTEAKGTA